MYEQILNQIGLNENQAIIYQTLIKSGHLPARNIVLKTGIKRGLVYKTLDQLLELGLIEKRDNIGTITLFFPSHPNKLKEILSKKEEDLKNIGSSFQKILAEFISSYNLFSGKPNVQFFEGIKGVEELYKDILYTKKDILLIRSTYDDKIPGFAELVKQQIKKQTAEQIKTRAITPTVRDTNYSIKRDKENLVERRMLEREKFTIPAQIIIYGNKVGITSYSNQMITTIIEDPGISETFRVLFETVWKTGKELRLTE